MFCIKTVNDEFLLDSDGDLVRFSSKSHAELFLYENSLMGCRIAESPADKCTQPDMDTKQLLKTKELQEKELQEKEGRRMKKNQCKQVYICECKGDYEECCFGCKNEYPSFKHCGYYNDGYCYSLEAKE